MKTVLNVKVDLKVKKEAQRVAKEMGLPMSIIVNNFLSNFIDEQQITFTSLAPNKRLERRLKKIDEDIKNKRNFSPVFHSAKEAIAYLHSKSK